MATAAATAAVSMAARSPRRRPAAVADRLGHGGQQRGADRRADLAAGVDHPADQPLVAVGHASAGGDHGAERGPGGAEADQHHRGQQRAVTAAGRQPGQSQEPHGGHGTGQDQHPADAHAAGQPGAEHPGGEPDHALRGDGQAGGQRREVQHLLEVERQDDQLARVPQAEQQVHRARLAQVRPPQQAGRDERLGMTPLDRPRTPCRPPRPAPARRARPGKSSRAVPLRHREHQRGDRAGDQQRPADVEPAGLPARPGATRRAAAARAAGRPRRPARSPGTRPASW